MQFRIFKPVFVVAVLCAASWFPQGIHGQHNRPSALNVQYLRAETAWRSGGSVLEAKARVDRVLEVLPDDVEALKLRAQVLMVMDRNDEALLDARRAVAINPDDGEAHLILCEAARLNQNLDLAERSLDTAAERVLDDAPFHIRMSWNAALLGHLDKAETYARVALALDESDASAYYQLARVFIYREQPDAAASVLASGLNNSILDPSALREDTLLVQVLHHPTLDGMVRR